MLGGLVGATIGIAYVGLGIAQIVAASYGLNEVFGGFWWLGFIVFVIWIMVGGPIIDLAMAAAALYGAHAAWGWPWWQAALFAFPHVAIAAVVMFAGGLSALRARA